MEADPGRTPLERGFYARHERRNITHIFIFDRAAASALVPLMAPIGGTGKVPPQGPSRRAQENGIRGNSSDGGAEH